MDSQELQVQQVSQAHQVLLVSAAGVVQPASQVHQVSLEHQDGQAKAEQQAYPDGVVYLEQVALQALVDIQVLLV